MNRQEASLFFQMISYRYQRGGVLITTNKSVVPIGFNCTSSPYPDCFPNLKDDATKLLLRAEIWVSTNDRCSVSLYKCTPQTMYAGRVLDSCNGYRENVSLSGWHAVPKASVEEHTTRSGSVVLTPIAGDRCWDAPLPCTPYFSENLQLRDPDCLGSGFLVHK